MLEKMKDIGKEHIKSNSKSKEKPLSLTSGDYIRHSDSDDEEKMFRTRKDRDKTGNILDGVDEVDI